MAKKRIDPIVAKAIKKQKFALERMNFIGDYRIHSVEGKGKKRVTIIPKQDISAKDLAKWVKKYNVHIYESKAPIIFEAVGQARIMRKGIVYINAELPEVA